MKINKNFVLDMDGVLVRGSKPIEGVLEFINSLIAAGKKFAILTNNALYTPRDLEHRLKLIGLEIPPGHIFTSAMATAQFLNTQSPNGSAYVIGESGITTALHDINYLFTDNDPEYVVLGETTNYGYEQLTTAIRLVEKGAKFIATNPDNNGPGENGIMPACGALAALIEKASGVSPYFIGKPNPLMMRQTLKFLDSHSEETVMVGDRMDTDIIAGMESGMETVLVLTGVSTHKTIKSYPFRPTHILNSVAEIEI